MNIFTTNICPVKSAHELCDKHVVKMIVEYAQLMSTAHRVLDGNEYYDKTKAGHRIKRWLHPDKNKEELLYKASHIKHPSGLWCRATTANYDWLYRHFKASCKEYTKRYGREHLTETKMLKVLSAPPKNLPKGNLTEFAVAIAQDQLCRQVLGFNKMTVVDKYKQYIKMDKTFATWTKRDNPYWF
tara:strand:+ start:53 stop:607 length:555 start_codon:yes stop_codon:yes gene_type:complete